MTPAGAGHLWTVRVYYEDTDFSGVVYHAAYLRFLERGRTEMLRAAGVDQRALFAAGRSFAVRRMGIDFVRPARMDDWLTVISSIEAIGGASLTLLQAVLRGDERLVEATVRIGLVADGKPLRLPPDLVRRMGDWGRSRPRLRDL